MSSSLLTESSLEGQIEGQKRTHRGPEFQPGLAAATFPALGKALDADVELMAVAGRLYIQSVQACKDVAQAALTTCSKAARDIAYGGYIKAAAGFAGGATQIGTNGYGLRKNAVAGKEIKLKVKQAKAYRDTFKEMQKQGPNLTVENGGAASTEQAREIADNHRSRCAALKRREFGELSKEGKIAERDQKALETVVDPEEQIEMEGVFKAAVEHQEAELSKERQVVSNQMYSVTGLGQAAATVMNAGGTAGSTTFDQDKAKEDGYLTVENNVFQQLANTAQRQASASDKANDMVPSITQSMNNVSNANTLRG